HSLWLVYPLPLAGLTASRTAARSNGLHIPINFLFKKYLIYFLPSGELRIGAQEGIMPDGDHQAIDLTDLAIVMHQLAHSLVGSIMLFVTCVRIHKTKREDPQPGRRLLFEIVPEKGRGDGCPKAVDT